MCGNILTLYRDGFISAAKVLPFFQQKKKKNGRNISFQLQNYGNISSLYSTSRLLLFVKLIVLFEVRQERERERKRLRQSSLRETAGVLRACIT